MPLKKIKNKFYRYINKKDFLLVMSLIIPSFIIMQLKSVSSYLDRKADFAKKHKPLQISVNYISYNDYIKYITKKNHSDNNNQNLQHQDDTVDIDYDNDGKSTNSFNEPLSSDLNEEKKEEESKKNNKPNKKAVEQKKPEIDYFIVQANGKFYSPEAVRKTGKRQMLKLDDVVLTDEKQPSEPVVVGKIANKTIHKETMKESLVNLFYSLLKIKKKKNINAVVYDTRYDAYGNRIKRQKKSKTKKSKKNTKQKTNNKTINEEEVVIINDIEQEQSEIENIKKITIQMVLDGKLQKNDTVNSLQNVNELTSYDKNTLLAIKELEYHFEKCWNEFAKKYINTEIFYKYRISYNENGQIQDVVLIDKNIPAFQEKTAQNMLEDIQEVINKCQTSQMENKNNNDYKFLEAIEITFQGATEI